MVLAVLMLADTVDIPALTVQAADYKSAETAVTAEQEAVSEENAAAMAAISANERRRTESQRWRTRRRPRCR